jgi:hypothetical protein
MKQVWKLLPAILATLIVMVIGLILWMQTLPRDDGPDKRPQYGTFSWEGQKPPRGGPEVRADGYVKGSLGHDFILPPMAPVRKWDIATKENIDKNAAIKTCFWPGGKGRSGLYTTDPDDFTIDNQFPDTGTTYGLTAFALPEGAKIVMKGKFPHERHWNFVTYLADGTPRDVADDLDINPDAGSFNPFRPGVRRDAEPRNYTLTITNGSIPSPRPANTLYTLSPANTSITLYMRNYVPDRSADWTGGAGLPEVELHLADGKVLKGDEACAATMTGMRGKQLAITVPKAIWLGLSSLPWRPADRTPAKPFEVTTMARFYNRQHLILDTFFPWLPSDFMAKDVGGFFANAATRYGLVYMSQAYGKVYVAHGKMPTTPSNWDGAATPMVQNADMRYWSLCTATAGPVGLTPDCVHDEVVRPTLDDKGNFNVVVSRAPDRPANATEKCGVVWMEYGNGDGIPGGSPNFGGILNRHTQVNPNFKHSWFAVNKPGTEQEVLGDYQVRVINMHEKARFEALGCPVDQSKLATMAGGK